MAVPTPESLTQAAPLEVAPRSTALDAELWTLLRLAGPLAAAQLGQMLLSAVDTAVVGRLGALELGAAGLGSTLFFMLAVIGTGVMLGLDPLVAQAVGAREPERAREHLWQGLWLATLLALPILLLGLGVCAALEPIGVEARAAAATRVFLLGRLPGLLPFLWFVGARSYLQAVGGSRWVIGAVVLANVVNVPLAVLFTFGGGALAFVGLGWFSFPALGVFGAGLGSSVATVAQLLVLAVGVRRLPCAGPVRRAPRPAALSEAFRLGLPIGLTFLAEHCVFALVNVLIAAYWPRSLPAHQVAITLASSTFMIPLGIGAAAAVRVGHGVGRRDPVSTRRSGLLALAAGGAFMTFSAVVFHLWPAELAGLFTADAETISLALPLIAVAAVFQLSDGLQAVAAGALRGAGDTRFPLLANLAGHYALGLPLGLGLAFGAGLGTTGLWWGLSLGLSAVAAAMTLRFFRLSANGIRPLGD